MVVCIVVLVVREALFRVHLGDTVLTFGPTKIKDCRLLCSMLMEALLFIGRSNNLGGISAGRNVMAVSVHQLKIRTADHVEVLSDCRLSFEGQPPIYPYLPACLP